MKPASKTLILILIFSCFGCRKSLRDQPAWTVSLLGPLVQTTLTLDDLIADSLLQSNADGSISLVFSNELFTFSLAEEAIEIPDTVLARSFSLQTLTLSDQEITYPFSLGAICQQLGLVGLLIIAQNGNSAVIPPFNDFTSGDNAVDATQLFESAVIESGFINITLYNGLPVEISNLIFQVRNQVSGEILAQDTFQNLLTLQQETKAIDMSGKTVEGTLIAKILDFDSPGSDGNLVLIDTSDAVVATLTAQNLQVSEATAIFPEQNLIDDFEEVKYILDGGAELKTMKVKSGTLKLTLQSTIQQQSTFSYELPGATDSYGNTISLFATLPPAPENGTSEYSESLDLSGFTILLTGANGDQYNTFTSHLQASIDSTGELVSISLQDSVKIIYSFLNVVPDYVSGYLGQQILPAEPDSTALGFFRNFRKGMLSLESAELNLSVYNGVGVEGRMNIYELMGINNRTGNVLALQWDQLGDPLSVSPATDNPLIASSNYYSLNNANSNIASFISNLPDELNFQADVFMNPYGNSSAWNDFAYSTSGIDVSLQAIVPLSLVADKLLLADTVDFSLSSVEDGEASITDGIFRLITENGFPVSAKAQAYFFNEYSEFVDSLFATPQEIESGVLNEACLVSQASKSVLSAAISAERMDKLRSASLLVLHVEFNTAETGSCNSFLKIYDHYSLDAKLTGEFNFYTGD